ncbi:MAG: tetratricopeptide repeat protein [Bryobacteraceae bacterium]|jgi:tetratricopeptide (TPR) repeat protein
MKICTLAIPAGMALFAFASLAQITGIEGVVKGEDGKPLQGAIIKIHRTDIKGEYATKPTDKKGHYIYNGLPYGKYDLTVWAGDKQLDELKGVQTRPGDLQQLNFDLKANKTPNAADANKQALAQKAMETGQISEDLARQLTPEQKKQLQEQIDKTVNQRKKNSALNQAYNDGIAALEAAPTQPSPAEKVQKYDAAIENLNKAGEVDPNQVAVWSHLAQAYQEEAGLKTGADHDAAVAKAIETYNKALTLKPDDASLHNNYALLLAKSGKFPDATSELEKAAQLEPANSCKYYYNLGALYTNAGQVDPALDTFKKAITADPNCADAYYQTGINLMAKVTTTPDGKMIPAPGTSEAFQKYLSLKPDGPYAQSAKEMLTTLGSTVDNTYKNPNAPPPKKKKGGL